MTRDDLLNDHFVPGLDWRRLANKFTTSSEVVREETRGCR